MDAASLLVDPVTFPCIVGNHPLKPTRQWLVTYYSGHSTRSHWAMVEAREAPVLALSVRPILRRGKLRPELLDSVASQKVNLFFHYHGCASN